MKIQCNACEAAEARVLCCADEAALCWSCDEKVHAANKFAGKHQRVPLTSSASPVPKCDICQEASGYFFCLEDRALFCRKCDTTIHSMNSHVSAHQRFLLTGVKIGAEASEQVSSSKEQLNPVVEVMEYPSKQVHKSSPMPSGETYQGVSSQVDKNWEIPASGLSGSTFNWSPEDFLDFSQNYGFTENGSYKADGGKLESLEGSPDHSSAGEELNNELSCQVPEISWLMPDIPSPPTASGLNWPKSSHRQFVEDSLFVPDVCYDFQRLQQCQRSSPVTKRRRL